MSKLDSLEARWTGPARFGAASRQFAVALQSAVERHPWSSFTLFSAFYFTIVFSLSSMKLLWLDELITLHIAGLGSVHAIWEALWHGVDPNPPVTYILVHASSALFGPHEFAYRLPAVIGYWIGILSLFLFLRRRVPPVWALAGTVVSTTMAAFEYSYESRSYGIFYGLAMLAVLCWSWTADLRNTRLRRALSLAGMTVALALGISVNYFAVLAFLPPALGELARTVGRAHRVSPAQNGARTVGYWRAADLRIWIAFIVAASPLLLYLPLIQHSIAEFAPYAWNKVSLDQVFDSYTQMVEMVLYPALALFAFAIGLRLLAARTEHVCSACRSHILPRWIASLAFRSREPLSIPFHEGVAVFALMAYPILGYLVASAHGGMLSPRFVIPVCFGFAIAITLVAFQLFGHLRPAGPALLCLALAWLICRESYVGYWYEEQKQCFYKIIDRLPEAEASVPPDAPIVIPDPLMVLTFRHYAPPGAAARVVLPLDFPAIRLFRGDDSPEENLWAGRDLLYKVRIEPMAKFQNTAGKYLILASDGNWFLDDLTVHHYPFDRLDIDTRAQAIGGFTPLAHGTPAFYIAYGGSTPSSLVAYFNRAVPFQAAQNLPRHKTYEFPKTIQ